MFATQRPFASGALTERTPGVPAWSAGNFQLQIDETAQIEPSAAWAPHETNQRMLAGRATNDYPRLQGVEMPLRERTDDAARRALAYGRSDIYSKHAPQLACGGISIEIGTTAHDVPPLGPKRSVLMRAAS